MSLETSPAVLFRSDPGAGWRGGTSGSIFPGRMNHAPLPIRIARLQDGTLTYLVDLPPEALPPVRGRDLAEAWEQAREAACGAAWGAARLFRFRRPDGGTTDLALSDEDACCWAAAVDATVGIGTSHGLSLCLRLLALVDLLGRASWLSQLFRIGRNGATLHPALLATAAEAPLDSDARFDEARFRARLGSAVTGLAASSTGVAQ